VAVAFHGSWNRTQRTGYKVARVAFSGSQPTGQVEDLASWLDARGDYSGRPVDVITTPNSSLLVSTDTFNRIVRIWRG
jgi:glucose/arabinose dehydrogenase